MPLPKSKLDWTGGKPIMHDVMGKDKIVTNPVRWWESKLTLPFLSELEYILELQAKDNKK